MQDNNQNLFERPVFRKQLIPQLIFSVLVSLVNILILYFLATSLWQEYAFMYTVSLMGINLALGLMFANYYLDND